MRDEQHRPLVAPERVLERLAGGDVEVVRRLVQQQEVAAELGQQRERDPAALPARQLPDPLEDVVAGEQKLPQEVPSFRDRPVLVRQQRLQNGLLGVEGLPLDLAVVAHHDVVPQLEAPPQRRQLPGQGAQQGRLAAAVRADERHPLAALDQHLALEAEQLVIAILTAVADPKIFNFEHLAAAGPLDGDREAQRFGRFGRLDLLALEALEQLASGLRLARAEVPARDVPLDKFFRLLDEPLLLLVDLALALQALALELEVLRVVAGVLREPPVLQLPDAPGELVDEIAIVRGDDVAALPALQALLEPLERLQIQMVRRLVQEQQLGLGEQQPGQGGPRPLPAAQLLEGLLLVLGREAQPRQHLVDLALVLVAAQRAVTLQQLVVLVEQPLIGVGVGALGQLALERPQPGLQLHELGLGLEHRLEERLPVRARALSVGIEIGLLGQVAQAQRAGPPDLPVVGLLQPGEEPQERALARAVRADQRDPVAPRDPQRDVPQHDLGAVALGQPLRRDDRHDRSLELSAFLRSMGYCTQRLRSPQTTDAWACGPLRAGAILTT